MNMEGKLRGKLCKVRKRRSTSSTSSSSLVQKTHRLKKAFNLVGKIGGSTTPVPMWKTDSTSPSLQNEKSFKFLASNGLEKGKDFSISARKLAATLWEINGVPTPKMTSSKFSSMARELSDPCFSPVSQRMIQSKEDSQRKRSSFGSKKLVLADDFQNIQNFSRIEVAKEQSLKKRLKNVRDGLKTSKELIKVLNKIWGVEEHYNSINVTTIFCALKAELDLSCIEVNNLIKQTEIEENVDKIAMELEKERKLRIQTERLNKKLGRELADTKMCLSRKVKELESEKKAREILEQVSDELARGIGEDRAEFEELKKQSAKVVEEVEKEREMLQLADILREERVQMKLSDAKYEFEEKNALVDEMRNELQTYLKNISPKFDTINELQTYLRNTLPNPSKHYQDDDNYDDDDDDQDDVHTIDLNTMNKKSSSEKIKISLERVNSDGIEWEFSPGKPLFSGAWKQDCADEIERYNMIKDLRDHVVSNSLLSSVEG